MEQEITPFQALEHATMVAGSQSALARICHVSQTAVWKWIQSSKRLPAEYVLLVENATGVSRHLLRPDIYPLEHGMRLPPLPSDRTLGHGKSGAYGKTPAILDRGHRRGQGMAA